MIKNTHNFKPIKGKYVNLREAEVDDAIFILALRCDEKKSRFLHKTENNLEKQIEYLKHYKTLDNEWYFIIENKQHKPKGTIRLYNIHDNQFTGGSWLMVSDALPEESIEGDILAGQYAFEKLGFEQSVFDVRKKNKKVVRYHLISGSKIIDETNEDYIFKTTKEDFLYKQRKFMNMLMSDDDLISVTIAAYNHENFIQETIRSIINQTYQKLELIIIDDGSSDSTYKKMLEMKPLCEKRFVRVIMETQNNIGVVLTGKRIHGLIRGKYSYAISSDDVIADKKAIEILHNYIADSPDVGLVVGNQTYIDEKSKPIKIQDVGESCIEFSDMSKRLHNAYGESIDGRWNLLKLPFLKYSDFWLSNPIPNGYLIRKQALDKCIFNVNAFNIEDLYMHYQISKFFKYKIINKVLMKNRIHRHNYFHSNLNRNALETRGLRFYEMYLLDTVYKDFHDPDCEKAPNFIACKNEWEMSKKSKLWDEEYYCSRYPDVREKGYIPLVHYLTYGIYEKRLPSSFFEGKEKYLFSSFNSLRWSRGKILKYKFHQYLRKKFLHYREKQTFQSSASFVKRFEYKIYKKLSKKLEYKISLPRDLNEEQEFKSIANGTYALNKILRSLGEHR